MRAPFSAKSLQRRTPALCLAPAPRRWSLSQPAAEEAAVGSIPCTSAQPAASPSCGWTSGAGPLLSSRLPARPAAPQPPPAGRQSIRSERELTPPDTAGPSQVGCSDVRPPLCLQGGILQSAAPPASRQTGCANCLSAPAPQGPATCRTAKHTQIHLIFVKKNSAAAVFEAKRLRQKVCISRHLLICNKSA